ncbi:hypothetical protein Tco_0873382 [Tanacetum coccineum]
MGYANPIRTLGDYSRPSHEGYRNTIELPKGNNVDYLTLTTVQYMERNEPLLYFNFPSRSTSNWLKLLHRRIHLHIGGSYYSFPCSILSTGKDHKTLQRYPDVLTTSRRISLRSTNSF